MINKLFNKTYKNRVYCKLRCILPIQVYHECKECLDGRWIRNSQYDLNDLCDEQIEEDLLA